MCNKFFRKALSTPIIIIITALDGERGNNDYDSFFRNIPTDIESPKRRKLAKISQSVKGKFYKSFGLLYASASEPSVAGCHSLSL